MGVEETGSATLRTK